MTALDRLLASYETAWRTVWEAASGPFDIPHAAAILVFGALLVKKQLGIAICLAASAIFATGLIQVGGRMEQENADTWLDLFLYVGVGAAALFTLIYGLVLRTKE
jgi:hypothetical protein